MIFVDRHLKSFFNRLIVSYKYNNDTGRIIIFPVTIKIIKNLVTQNKCFPVIGMLLCESYG